LDRKAYRYTLTVKIINPGKISFLILVRKIVKQKPTAWGLNVDIAAFVTVAIFVVLYYVFSQVSLPIGPNTSLTFGEVFMWLGAALFGPIWAALIGSIGIAYDALIVSVSPLTILGLTLEGLLAGIFMKKLPLTGSAVLAQLSATPYWYWLLNIISGNNVEMTWLIISRGIVNQAFNAVIASLLLALPGITKFLPITYDSKPVRDLLS
jgi:uncharacterized membrane protein